MFKTRITGFQDESILVNGSRNSLQIARDATAAGGIAEPLKNPSAAHDNDYLIAGWVLHGGTAVALVGERDRVTVAETGHVVGHSIGLLLGGDDNRLVSSGEIVGSPQGIGILAHGGTGTQIRNNGLITGGRGIDFEGVGGVVINEKLGIVAGNDYALGSSSVVYGNVKFINHGLLIGSNGTAFSSEAQTVKLINDGTIRGDVRFGEGGCTFDNRGGLLKGAIIGGTGDDTLIIDNAKYVLMEQAGGGYDSVRSSVSYTLNDNVEGLALIGKADVKARGNAAHNDIDGNAGDNVLKGLDGDDYLAGGRGDDALFGGNGEDHFIFRTGDGHDVIEDFRIDEDSVLLSGWRALGGNVDGVLAHAHAHHGSTVIEAGADSLTLKGVHLGDLDAVHFMFAN